MARPHNKIILLAWLTFMAQPGHPVYAQTTNELPVSLSVGTRYFNYEEFSTSGNSLNKETGFIPGLNIKTQISINRYRHQFEMEAWHGDVDYDGQLQSGQPHNTQTEQQILMLQYNLAYQDDNASPLVYVGASWQRWDRDIQPANTIRGLFERYQWWQLHAGFKSIFYQDNNQKISFDFNVFRTNAGSIEIDLSADGFGKPELQLGNGNGIKLNTAWLWPQSKTTTLGLVVNFTHWKFGRGNTLTVSNGSTVITVTEPRSESNHSDIRFVYTVSF